MGFDLILKGGRVIDPSQKLDQIADIAFKDGKVNRILTNLEADAAPTCATSRAASSRPA